MLIIFEIITYFRGIVQGIFEICLDEGIFSICLKSEIFFMTCNGTMQRKQNENEKFVSVDANFS